MFTSQCLKKKVIIIFEGTQAFELKIQFHDRAVF
jgi:hypothetical protein